MLVAVRESCGVFGMVSLKGENVTPYIYWALLTLSHRGQQSHGVLTFKKGFRVYKGLGLLADLDWGWLRKKAEDMAGGVGIGHVRYATSGKLSRDQLLKDAGVA